MGRGRVGDLEIVRQRQGLAAQRCLAAPPRTEQRQDAASRERLPYRLDDSGPSDPRRRRPGKCGVSGQMFMVTMVVRRLSRGKYLDFDSLQGGFGDLLGRPVSRSRRHNRPGSSLFAAAPRKPVVATRMNEERSPFQPMSVTIPRPQVLAGPVRWFEAGQSPNHPRTPGGHFASTRS